MLPGAEQPEYISGNIFLCGKWSNIENCHYLKLSQARFIRRISTVSNAIETIDNEMICFIIYCLNCIRHGRNATYERGLSYFCRTLQNIFWYSFFKENRFRHSTAVACFNIRPFYGCGFRFRCLLTHELIQQMSQWNQNVTPFILMLST